MAKLKVAGVLLAVLSLGGGCAAGIAMLGHDNPAPTAGPSLPPATASPDHRFKDDMDRVFGPQINQGKGVWDHRYFTDQIVIAGRQTCDYLRTHSIEETMQWAKTDVPVRFPSGTDARFFVNLAIQDLCSQQSDLTATPEVTSTTPRFIVP